VDADKIWDVGGVFAYTTGGDTGKQMARPDSGHQIGLTPTWNDVLRAREGACVLRFAKWQNLRCFWVWKNNERYEETDGRVGFRALNRCRNNF
jgi:hypothetical protein